MRNGPVKYLKRNAHGGNLRTSMSVRKRGWVEYDEDAACYKLSGAGFDALCAGDRRYKATQIAYDKRPL